MRISAATPSPGPRDTILQTKGRRHGFRIQVLYQVRNRLQQPVQATRRPPTRNGQRMFAGPLSRGCPATARCARQRAGLKLPVGKKIRFYITIPKAALLARRSTPRAASGSPRRASSHPEHAQGRRSLTVRDGHIKVSIARIRSGALPGLKGIL